MLKVTKKLLDLISDMRESMVEARGVGIAAPQVWRSERVCLVSIDGNTIALINPQITWRSEELAVDEEGCLSLPHIWVQVPRSVEIQLTYLDERGKLREKRLKAFDARVVQHELDHLEGVLIVDYQ